MKKELEIWQFAAARLKRGEAVVLLVVAESSGSSPGRQGFKMVVARDEITGSVGGGVMEVNLVESARRLLKEKEKINFIKRQVHRKNSPDASGMICSGGQTVILCKLESQDLPTIRQIIRTLKTHQSTTLEISNLNFQVAPNQSNEFDFRFERKEASGFLFQEKLGSKNKLFIVGGGHCALALSELMSKMDFYIALFDDRADLNTLAKNEYVHEKHRVESYDKIDDYIPPGANHFVVVMTLGYQTDEIVIKRLLDKNFKYFGVLGSFGKMATLLKDLKKAGFSEDKLNRMRTPIGLPIGSRTPEEIAVSIAAEIIQVKNKTP